jgi:hypothetical protein
MKNSLWFTLNKAGYCVRYERTYAGSNRGSGYLIEPKNRVDFISLVRRLATESINSDFYDNGIKLSFDSHGELPVPQLEKEVIQAVINAIEVRAKQNLVLKSKLEQICRIAQ